MRLRFVGALLSALVILALPLGAQETSGGLTGVVTDTSKAPVPGATVTATNTVTGAPRTVVTGSDGKYLIPDLAPGRYGVVIELQGFQKVTADDVLVLLGRTYSVDAELRPPSPPVELWPG